MTSDNRQLIDTTFEEKVGENELSSLFSADNPFLNLLEAYNKNAIKPNTPAASSRQRDRDNHSYCTNDDYINNSSTIRNTYTYAPPPVTPLPPSLDTIKANILETMNKNKGLTPQERLAETETKASSSSLTENMRQNCHIIPNNEGNWGTNNNSAYLSHDELANIVTMATISALKAIQNQPPQHQIGVENTLQLNKGNFDPHYPLQNRPIFEQLKQTTVMIKNIPSKYTRHMLIEDVKSKMPIGSFDFIYMPIDFRTRSNFGYAFINLTSSVYVPVFKSLFNGTKFFLPKELQKLCRNNKNCEVTIARVQGLEANIDRLLNSPIMLYNSNDHDIEFGEFDENEGMPVLFDERNREVPFPRPDPQKLAQIISTKSPMSLVFPPHTQHVGGNSVKQQQQKVGRRGINAQIQPNHPHHPQPASSTSSRLGVTPWNFGGFSLN